MGVQVAAGSGALAAGSGGAAGSVRTPDTFKSVSASAAGSTVAWAPAAGKRFRLMRFLLTISNNATLAVAGVLTVALLDAAGSMGLSFPVFVGTVALTNLGNNGITIGWIDLGNGELSSAVNNALNVNLSVALVTGVIGAVVAGTEE